MSRAIPLKTVGEIRHEMAKVYREARNGTLKIAEASKLNYMLKDIGRVAEIEHNLKQGAVGENIAEGLTSIAEAISKQDTLEKPTNTTD